MGTRCADHVTRSLYIYRPLHESSSCFYLKNCSYYKRLLHDVKQIYSPLKLLVLREAASNFLTFFWPCISGYLSQYLTKLMHKICFTISFISCLYMFRAHVEAWNKLVVKQKFCASIWLNTEIKCFKYVLCKRKKFWLFIELYINTHHYLPLLTTPLTTDFHLKKSNDIRV